MEIKPLLSWPMYIKKKRQVKDKVSTLTLGIILILIITD